MKKKISFVYSPLLILIISFPIFSQGQGEPYHPMTAPGAKQILPNYHTLYWENPPGIVYNKVYLSLDSLKVATMDASALILDGYPDLAYSSADLDILVNWLEYTKYYWKVVEYNSTTNTQGPVWYFKTLRYPSNYFVESFENGMDNWQILGPNGFSNWSIVNSASAGGSPPELRLSWTPEFVGTSFIMCNFELSSINYISFHHYVDWYAESFQLGVATINSGNTLNSTWEISPNGNIGPEIIFNEIIDALDDYKVGFYFSGNSYNLDYWYLDNVEFDYILTPPNAPRFLTAIADTNQLKVYLDLINFYSDSSSLNSNEYNYQIIRKAGLPEDTVGYFSIALIPITSSSYIDEDILPNQLYTYRVRTVVSDDLKSRWCNEATAYVPNIVPVELQSFSAEVIGSDVQLLWSTATETNNQGFEILRSAQNDSEWKEVGFVPGFGTTTEVHHYSFIDEPLQSGDYQYRLKQIDFDGTFEYSNIIEVTVDGPTKFSLEQNYPNPFNPTTKIKYSIADVIANEVKQSQIVTLKVYDVLGNEIATLVNEQKPAGTYEVEFNASELPSGISARGRYTSGIYFYQLKVGPFIETKKMILLK